jgi:hypothetical protein
MQLPRRVGGRQAWQRHSPTRADVGARQAPSSGAGHPSALNSTGNGFKVTSKASA